MGTEDSVFTCTKLTTTTKKQRLKIWSRDWIFKNTVLKTRRRRGKKERKHKQTKQTTTTTKKKTKPQELLKIIIREIEYLKIYES